MNPGPPSTSSSSSHFLITGGAGFVGSHLIEHLVDSGLFPDLQITIIDDLSTGRASNLEHLSADTRSRITFVNATVGDALPDLPRQSFDGIFHLAAAVGVRLILDEPIRTIQTNILETARLLEFAHLSKTPILIASSSEVYGKSVETPFREDDDVVYGSTKFTRWSYACTKAIDEYLALAYANQHQHPVVVTRFFNTVGPRQIGSYGMVLPRFVESALKSQPLSVYGDGSQQRCFCDVRDVVQALPKLLTQSNCHGEVYNIGSDRILSILELAQCVIDTLNSTSTIQFIPYEKAYGQGFEDLAVRQPDITRIHNAIGFQPTIPLEQTIRDIATSMNLPAD